MNQYAHTYWFALSVSKIFKLSPFFCNNFFFIEQIFLPEIISLTDYSNALLNALENFPLKCNGMICILSLFVCAYVCVCILTVATVRFGAFQMVCNLFDFARFNVISTPFCCYHCLLSGSSFFSLSSFFF